MYTASDLRKGLKVQIDGQSLYRHGFRVFQARQGAGLVPMQDAKHDHRQPACPDVSFGRQIRKAELDERKMQYLYNQEDEYHFMDTDNYEQVVIDREQLGDNVNFLMDNMEVEVLFFDGKAIDVSLPIFVNLEVIRADPWAKGDTSGTDTKPVTVQTGYELQVPPFVEEGDKIQIDTRTGEYVTRVKE